MGCFKLKEVALSNKTWDFLNDFHYKMGFEIPFMHYKNLWN